MIRRPEDLGINLLQADRNLLAARSIRDLVTWSDGLYAPPSKFETGEVFHGKIHHTCSGEGSITR